MSSYKTNYKGQISVSAYIREIVLEDKSGQSRILLSQVCINKESFRDHIWINTQRQTSKIDKGDSIMAFAKIREYIRKDGTRGTSIKGLRSIEANSPRFKNHYKEGKK